MIKYLPVIMLLVFAEDVFAMHVADGILSPPWALFWFAVTLPFIYLGIRTLQKRSVTDPFIKPMVALIGAGVFVISCMPIPIPTTGTCSHPCGTGMAAILIGPLLSILVSSIALTFQALFLAHGGITTLGANIFAMGVVGSFVGYGSFLAAKKIGLPILAAAFLAGLTADWSTYIATSFILATGLSTQGSFLQMFLGLILAFIPTQIPLGILEGFISAGAYRFVRNRRPEYLAMLNRGEA